MKFGSLLKRYLSAAEEEKKPSPHSYASVPTIKVPPPATSSKEVKADVISKEWNKEVEHTCSCSAQLEAETSRLIPEKVYRWKFKNYSKIAQKMKQLEKFKAKEMPENVSVVMEEERHEEKKQDELWIDMMKNHQERHFRIDRITNFFKTS